MRPIQKWAVGHINPETKKAILKKYNPSNTARPDLEDNLGPYCGYCEVFNATTQVDHIVSKDQIKVQNLPKEKKYLKRWFHRDVAWQHAVKSLAEYEVGQVDAAGIANIAHWRGFFSVWFTVFMAHKDVKKALIDRFEGTAMDCFNKDYNPIPRNPDNLEDTL
jgi:hypothetical protein